ncbi:MAG: succinate dehydrogenase [Alphaproteobacteria bacterium]|nr:succinate dehydrogenase [Alphaproteobacteria bacterium]
MTTAARGEIWLWLAQRASAAVLAACVVIHLALIIYAARVGLSAAAILGRTHGSLIWFGFYLVFVAAVAVHAPIGLRSILREMTPWHGRSLDAAAVVFAGLLAVLGVRAIWGLYA